MHMFPSSDKASTGEDVLNVPKPDSCEGSIVAFNEVLDHGVERVLRFKIGEMTGS